MKRAAVAALALAGVLALTGCGNSDSPKQDTAASGLSSSTVTTPSGRRVECVTFWDNAVSCDWGTAK